MMAVDFDPTMAKLVSEGHAARSLLVALEGFCAALVEETLKGVDRQIANAVLSAEGALASCYELAAYRRIVARLRQRVIAGERAEERHAAGHREEQHA
jgi:hypothetical protein